MTVPTEDIEITILALKEHFNHAGKAAQYLIEGGWSEDYAYGLVALAQGMVYGDAPSTQ